MKFCTMKKICLITTITACAIVIFSVFLRYRDDKMTCIFCDIVAKKTDTVFLYEDETFLAFKDIRPSSKFHFLVITKKHIPNVLSLTQADKEMLESMKKTMLEVLAKHNQTDENEISLGFHVPPFTSVKHLHLHGISPKSEMGFISKLMFKANSWWYKSVENVIESLPADSS